MAGQMPSGPVAADRSVDLTRVATEGTLALSKRQNTHNVEFGTLFQAINPRAFIYTRLLEGFLETNATTPDGPALLEAIATLRLMMNQTDLLDSDSTLLATVDETVSAVYHEHTSTGITPETATFAVKTIQEVINTIKPSLD